MSRTGLHIILLGIGLSMGVVARAQNAYFIDGYHGGIYGHIPPWQTRFMVDKLKEFPNWKINLELEPESWDTIEVKDKAAYDEFAALYADQSADARIEYINPAYAQSYLYDISGESVIRQFYFGIRKLRQHFPNAQFVSYSSEEPCFTSALPQILDAFGFRYASLKNPNTCWGGYSRAFGGELVNWIGPDGSSITTSPRYAVEALKPKSTWETIASNNSVAYVRAAFAYGITHPIGMCLQDAGWAYGPWLKRGAPGDTNNIRATYQPTVYQTWRGYMEQIAATDVRTDWHFSQEDVLVSLVWGGQILQHIARQVRASENRIIQAEKLASMAAIYAGMSWPSLDDAWRTLLLSQHHDCWIVPYNGKPGATWADKVVEWTGNTRAHSDAVLQEAMGRMSGGAGAPGASQPASAASQVQVRIFNTTSTLRKECVSVPLPSGWAGARVLDVHRQPVRVQVEAADSTGQAHAMFVAAVPALGYTTYTMDSAASPAGRSAMPATASVTLDKDGTYLLQTDLYRLRIDPAKGGIIRSLVARQLQGREFVDQGNRRSFDELRGNFYTQGGFHSSTESPASVRILENGPVRVKVEIKGQIAGTDFTQVLTLAMGQRRIDLHLLLDWTHNTGIGESQEAINAAPDGGKETLRKAFYNDSFKLQALFPLALAKQKVYKDAPFDVLKSRLSNTFFNRWDSIKNVVLLHWVDVTDGTGSYGMAVYTDHTTSYAHGEQYPLGLTLQYSGNGLFYRDYTLTGPSEMNYALVPHEGTWDKAGLWTEETTYDEPLQVWEAPVGAAAATPLGGAASAAAAPSERSLFQIPGTNLEVSSLVFNGDTLLARFFNAEGDNAPRKIYMGFTSGAAAEVALNGNLVREIPIHTDASGRRYIELAMPRFGFRTVRFAILKPFNH